jgi:hypothetical protein
MITRKTVRKTAAKPTRPVARKTSAATKAPATPKTSPAAAPRSKATTLNGASAKDSGKKKGVQGKAKNTSVKKEKIKKAKLVRDSFTMPDDEYQGLGEIKKACLKAGFEVKKSELLRIGVAVIRKMDAAAIKGMLSSLAPLKAGRPKKEK